MADEEPKNGANAEKVNGSPAPAELLIVLRKPVMAHGDEIKELKFREPTAGDIERCGNPVNLEFDEERRPKMLFEAKAMSAMMSTLAAVPPSTIRQLHPKDWENAAWNLAGFFMPDL